MLRKGSILVAGLIFVAIAYYLVRDEFGWAPDDDPAKRSSPSEARETPPRPVSPPMPETRDLASGEGISAEPAERPAPTQVALPSLGESDAFVRERLEPYGLPPDWIAQDALIGRFAVVLDNATRGDWPRRPLRFLKPIGRFRVVERDGRLYADPRNAARFEAELDLLESIEPSSAASLLQTIGPLIDEALGGLGRPVEWRPTILDAIDWVRSAPAIQGEHELVRPNVLYQYADPKLEALPPLEKQLIRLGPRNLERLKAYLGRLRAELDLDSRL